MSQFSSFSFGKTSTIDRVDEKLREINLWRNNLKRMREELGGLLDEVVPSGDDDTALADALYSRTALRKHNVEDDELRVAICGTIQALTAKIDSLKAKV